uniref:Uncharacterized protein n=1 Tax=Plectus sambesii TaxID=2011161 RepID=A0A914W1F3_9BILA
MPLKTVLPCGSDRPTISKRQSRFIRSMSPEAFRERIWRGAAKLARDATSVESTMDKPLYEVFLGGSCGTTVWRSQQVIPHLKKLGISYYDPQRTEWSEHMINEEAVAKENSRLFLFVLDPTTVNATSFLEIAYFAARRAPKLVVVFLNPQEWNSKGHPTDMSDRHRTCDLLDTILRRHSVPLLHSIDDALCYIDRTIVGEMTVSNALRDCRTRPTFINIKAQDTAVMCRNALQTVAPRRMFTLMSGVLFHPDAFSRYFMAAAMGVELLVMSLMCSWYRDVPLLALLATFLGVSVLTSAMLNLSCSVYRKRSMSSTHARPGRRRRRQRTDSQRAHQRKSVGYDVFMGCSASCATDTEWITDLAVPLLHKKGLSYSDCSFYPDSCQRIRVMANSSQVLYYIPSFRTFLSGIVEIAYFLGHSDWKLVVCVPKEASQLAVFDDDDEETRNAIERRNRCYAMALCYLNDMAARRHCRIFSRLQDALKCSDTTSTSHLSTTGNYLFCLLSVFRSNYSSMLSASGRLCNRSLRHSRRQIGTMADRVLGTKPSIWVEFTGLAAECKAVNIGQGFPDSPVPKHITEFLKDIASHPESTQSHQYTRGFEAVARAFEAELEWLKSTPEKSYLKTLMVEELLPKREFMANFLRKAGFKPIIPESGYFMMADFSALDGPFRKEDSTGDPLDYRFVRWLCKEKKLAGIPPSAFYCDENKHMGENFVRFCFYKKDETLAAAAKILDDWVKNVTELCFKACVRDFTSRTIEDKEEKCNNNCLDKFLKMSQRMGLRFQEYQLLQAESSGATLRQ